VDWFGSRILLEPSPNIYTLHYYKLVPIS